jgi:hypothetical protein
MGGMNLLALLGVPFVDLRYTGSTIRIRSIHQQRQLSGGSTPRFFTFDAEEVFSKYHVTELIWAANTDGLSFACFMIIPGTWHPKSRKKTEQILM